MWPDRADRRAISRTLAGYFFDMQIAVPREKVRIKPGMVRNPGVGGRGPGSNSKHCRITSTSFTTASSSTRMLYPDLFAGASQNFERGTGEVILGSGQRALAATPPFTRVVLCEHQTRTANRLESNLREAYPDRDPVALAGDCNVEIPCYLKTLTVDWRRCAAVFAMVDQYSAEATWETLKVPLDLATRSSRIQGRTVAVFRSWAACRAYWFGRSSAVEQRGEESGEPGSGCWEVTVQ